VGLIRKVISGSAAVATGGLSLGLVQFRSDTERGTRQTKLARQDLERQHQEVLRVEQERFALEQERLALMRERAAVAASRNEHAAALSSEKTASQHLVFCVRGHENHYARQDCLVCGAALSQRAPSSNAVSVVDQLERLVKLRNAGHLTEQEFAAQKARLIPS
jgi:hypothetical protein